MVKPLCSRRITEECTLRVLLLILQGIYLSKLYLSSNELAKIPNIRHSKDILQILKLMKDITDTVNDVW